MITGISSEPWHFRYVGYPYSKIMDERNLSLEEYIEFIKGYSYNSPMIYHRENKTGAKIYYVPAKDHGTKVNLPDDGVRLVSGNNVDGFVLTVFDKL